MLKSLDTQVRELGRSAPYAKISEQATTTTALIAGTIDEEKAMYEETVCHQPGGSRYPFTLPHGDAWSG